MEQEPLERGSAVLLQVEFKKQAPFGALTLFDPTGSPTVTVTDSAGDDKVDAQNLIKQNVGQWYFIVQTDVAWLAGIYKAKVNATDGTYNDIEIEPMSFELRG